MLRGLFRGLGNFFGGLGGGGTPPAPPPPPPPVERPPIPEPDIDEEPTPVDYSFYGTADHVLHGPYTADGRLASSSEYERIMVLPGDHYNDEFSTDKQRNNDYASFEEALTYADEIPVPTVVFRQPNGYWGVAVDY